MTQLPLANAVGVTPATVNNLERGQDQPYASRLRTLSRVFGVSLEEMGPWREKLRREATTPQLLNRSS